MTAGPVNTIREISDPSVSLAEAPEPTAASDQGVLCPRCHQRSQDASFCDHCQFELPVAGFGGTVPVEMSPVPWSAGSIVVQWPEDPSQCFECGQGENRFRVRGIRPELWPALAAEVHHRQSTRLNVLPPISLLELGEGRLILTESWHQEGGDQPDPFGSLPSQSVEELLVETVRWCRTLGTALTELHGSGHVWFEFDPQAIESNGSQLRITNMDWRLFPVGRCPTQFARISPSYSPPEIHRFLDEVIGPRTDVYHLALFAYYRLAGLGPKGFPGRGLDAFGFDIPPLRVFRPDLPLGIGNVLRRSLSINAANRQASVGELIDELECVATRCVSNVPTGSARHEPRPTDDSVLRRFFRIWPGKPAASPSEVSSPTVVIGSYTIAGKAKSALGLVNQDQVIVHHEAWRDRELHLIIVADGVSTARIGSGEIASSLACEVIVEQFRTKLQQIPKGEQPAWDNLLIEACHAASQAIVQKAMSLPDRIPTFTDSDLMSTTALIGVLDACELTLANVGDSRAYVVRGCDVEQLTIDGDVATSMLAAGYPPEQIMELGSSGKALRYCLGACQVAEDGGATADSERSTPRISRWIIEPEDTMILCTDGLVEERVFLEPDDLVEILQSNSEASPQALAERLVAAADLKQRLPSETEPNGYGDNITCAVLRLIDDRATHRHERHES